MIPIMGAGAKVAKDQKVGVFMDISIVLVVLGAAFLHAFWNFLVRGTHDKALGMAAVMFGHLPLAFIGLFYAGLPPEGAWPYVMASAVLHLGYQVFLLNAYRFGELTQIYPVARGASPLLITQDLIVKLLRAGLHDRSKPAARQGKSCT